MGHPTVYPTGVTIYDPERSWSGYTIFQAAGVGALLIDMNGREVQLWGAAPLGRDREVVVEGVNSRGEDAAFCVIADGEEVKGLPRAQSSG